jgi:hypothetical protein
MKATPIGRGKSDESYIEWLKSDLGSLIDELELEDLQKRTLRSRWLDQVVWMEGRANHARNWYYGLRLTSIIGGILIPVSVTASKTDSLGWFSWVATGLGLVVATASAVEEFFHYGDRWRHYRNTVELLKIEGWQLFQLSGPYRHYESHADAHKKFADRVEDIICCDVETYISKIAGEQEDEEGEE